VTVDVRTGEGLELESSLKFFAWDVEKQKYAIHAQVVFLPRGPLVFASLLVNLDH
jgi:hypothetical protein